MDVKGLIQTVPKPIESCTQSDVELICQEFWVISLAEPRLPLQIDDATRATTEEVGLVALMLYRCAQKQCSGEIE